MSGTLQGKQAGSLRFAGTLFLIILLGSCSAEIDSPSTLSENRQPGVRIGFIPDQSPEQLLNQYTPLVDYLEAETGVEFSIVVAPTYDQIVTMLLERQIDMVNFGALTFLQASANDSVVPLVMRDTDLQFTSHFLINTSSKAKTLAEAKGLRFLFGSEYSTSGHLMPRYFLNTQNITPETFFKTITYSGAHDKTALLVQQGKADLGAANSLVITRMFREGALDPKLVRTLWVTPPYVDYVWAIRDDINLTVKDSIVDAFLNLSQENAEHRHILKLVQAKYYVPALPNDFNNLKKLASNLGYLNGGP